MSRNVFQVVDRFKSVSAKFNNKIKNTFIERSIDYLKNVARDYKEVYTSARQDIKDRPFKATMIFTGLGLASLLTYTKPTETSFRAKYIEYANEAALVDPSLVRQEAIEHLEHIENCYNRHLIRYRSLLFFSIMWIDTRSSECDIYESNCSYLQWQYSKFSSRILDVGFLNIWWTLSKNMLDYDVNYV